jgi:hypothetical protein
MWHSNVLTLTGVQQQQQQQQQQHKHHYRQQKQGPAAEAVYMVHHALQPAVERMHAYYSLVQPHSPAAACSVSAF